MRQMNKFLIFALWLGAIACARPGPAQDNKAETVIRLANGAPVEGAFNSAAAEGLTVQTASGVRLLPWKYLSAGTRWRYERPMLAELETKRIKAGQEAKTAAGTNKSAKITAPGPAKTPPATPAAR